MPAAATSARCSYDLEVPDFAKAPFSISGLVLTSAAGSRDADGQAPTSSCKAVLPGPPIALRTFPQNDEIALFAEVYDNAGGTPHKVDITATVTTDEGKVMFKTDEERDSSDLRRQERRLRLHGADSAEGSAARAATC